MAKLTKNAGRVLPIFKGDYSSVVRYLPMDVVNQDDDSWVCKKECTGIKPSKANEEYWQPFGTAIHSKYNARLSQSYANGEVLNDDGTPFREGQEFDNAKYYSELSKQSALNTVSEVKEELKEYSDSAKQSAIDAKKFRDDAESITHVEIATNEKTGIVKPDGITITVDDDGTLHGADTTIALTQDEVITMFNKVFNN